MQGGGEYAISAPAMPCHDMACIAIAFGLEPHGKFHVMANSMILLTFFYPFKQLSVDPSQIADQKASFID